MHAGAPIQDTRAAPLPVPYSPEEKAKSAGQTYTHIVTFQVFWPLHKAVAVFLLKFAIVAATNTGTFLHGQLLTHDSADSQAALAECAHQNPADACCQHLIPSFNVCRYTPCQVHIQTG